MANDAIPKYSAFCVRHKSDIAPLLPALFICLGGGLAGDTSVGIAVLPHGVYILHIAIISLERGNTAGLVVGRKAKTLKLVLWRYRKYFQHMANYIILRGVKRKHVLTAADAHLSGHLDNQ